MEKSIGIKIWARKPELKPCFDTILKVLNDLYPERDGEHVEFVEGLGEQLTMLVSSYYPECLVGKQIQIYDNGNTSNGTNLPDEICTVQNITTERTDVYRGSFLLMCYVEAKDGFNYTRYFNWDKCKEFITELD